MRRDVAQHTGQLPVDRNLDVLQSRDGRDRGPGVDLNSEETPLRASERADLKGVRNNSAALAAAGAASAATTDPTTHTNSTRLSTSWPAACLGMVISLPRDSTNVGTSDAGVIRDTRQETAGKYCSYTPGGTPGRSADSRRRSSSETTTSGSSARSLGWAIFVGRKSLIRGRAMRAPGLWLRKRAPSSARTPPATAPRSARRRQRSAVIVPASEFSPFPVAFQSTRLNVVFAGSPPMLYAGGGSAEPVQCPAVRVEAQYRQLTVRPGVGGDLLLRRVLARVPLDPVGGHAPVVSSHGATRTTCQPGTVVWKSSDSAW